MKHYLPRIFCLWVCLLWSGCGIIIPESIYIWSENYALDKNGGRCSIPEVIDGDLQTPVSLGVQAVGILNPPMNRKEQRQPPAQLRRFDSRGRNYSFTQAKVYPQVDIQFREKLSIDKIVIHATNLYTLDVYWRDDAAEWRMLASVRQNPKNPVVVHAHAVTNAILLDVKPQVPIRSSQLLRHSAEFALEVKSQIAEIEVYGKMPKKAS